MWVGVLPIDRGSRVRYVRIEVIDTGSGMPVEVMERMLEPFYTTKGIGKGTGLGLAAVHGIISAHRGAMMIESMPGEGTRIQCLPADHRRGGQRTGPTGRQRAARLRANPDRR